MKFLDKYWSFLNEGASLDQIYDKFYKDKVKRLVFEELIMADPTTRLKEGIPVKKGRYSDWIIKLYVKSKNKDRFYEDLYKIKEGLELFHRFKDKLDIDGRDVNNFKSINDLLDMTDGLVEFQEQAELEKEEMEDIYRNTVKILDNKKYLVVIPKSKESSCYYGNGTRWCTAADNYNAFNEYNRDGNLYIIIDRANDAKYQLHVGTTQYMDEDDERINLPKFIKNNQEAILPIIDWIMDEVNEGKDKPINDNKPHELERLVGDAVTFSTENVGERLKDFLIENPYYTKKVPLLSYLTSLRSELGDARINDYMRKDGKDYLIVDEWSDLKEFFKNEESAETVLKNEHDDWGDYYYGSGWSDFDDSISDVIGCMENNEQLNKDIRHSMIGDEVGDGDYNELVVTEENYMSFDVKAAWDDDDDTVPQEVKDAYGQALVDDYRDKVYEHYSDAVLYELGDKKLMDWNYPGDKGSDPELMVNITTVEYYLEAFIESADDPDTQDFKNILVEGLKEGSETRLIWFDDRWDAYPDFVADIFIESYQNR